MIKEKDVSVVAASISDWIKMRVSAARAKTAVVGLSGGADSALVAILSAAVLPTVAVAMPCQSSPSSLERAQELARKFNILLLNVDLSGSFESISAQVSDLRSAQNTAGKEMQFTVNQANWGALRSCLRAPTLDYVAKLTNGLVVGTGNRDEDEVTRYFQKRGDGSVDISPIAKLHKSEVYQLLKYLRCPQSIIDAVPTADLWGPDSGQEDEKELGLSYQEVEWGIRFNDRHHIFDDVPNVSSRAIMELTPRQLQVLQLLAKMERSTRHKAQMPPVFDVRKLNETAFS